MDYEIQRCTHHCTATGRELVEGEEFYSVLVAVGGSVERHDYSQEAWQGPPADSLGWWKSRIPTKESKRARLAPNEVLLQLFQEFEGAADKEDVRFVMSLLLMRRRVLRLEETERDNEGREVSVYYCPRDEMTYRVHTVAPDENRAKEIEAELSRLLFATAA